MTIICPSCREELPFITNMAVYDLEIRDVMADRRGIVNVHVERGDDIRSHTSCPKCHAAIEVILNYR